MMAQVRMISKQLRSEGRLDPPPDIMSSVVLSRVPMEDIHMQNADADADAITSVPAKPKLRAARKTAPGTHSTTTQPEHEHDKDVEMADPPQQHRYKEPDLGVTPNYFLKYRDHEAFSHAMKPPPKREHRLPRKPAITTKLGPKAKRKKEEKLLTLLVKKFDPTARAFAVS